MMTTMQPLINMNSALAIKPPRVLTEQQFLNKMERHKVELLPNMFPPNFSFTAMLRNNNAGLATGETVGK